MKRQNRGKKQKANKLSGDTCFYYFLKKKMFFLILQNTKEVTAVM